MRGWRRFLAHWQNWLGLLLVALFFFVALAAPWLSPQDPAEPGPIRFVGRTIDYLPKPPSAEAPLGTLPGQISVFHSLVWGTRSALVFGLAVALFTALVGVVVGTLSAYFGGFLNGLLMRLTDAFLAFPIIAGVVLIQQLLSIALANAGAHFAYSGIPSSTTGYIQIPENLPFWLDLLNRLNSVSVAFILFSWMPYARIMNTMVLRAKQTQYIQAARALGAGHSNLIFRHLIPNSITPIIVLAARDVGGMVLLQATFTFIGLGGGSLWGNLLVWGRDYIISPGGLLTYWWVFLPATLTLVLFGIGWNLLGDGLNDLLNPRTR